MRPFLGWSLYYGSGHCTDVPRWACLSSLSIVVICRHQCAPTDSVLGFMIVGGIDYRRYVVDSRFSVGDCPCCHMGSSRPSYFRVRPMGLRILSSPAHLLGISAYPGRHSGMVLYPGWQLCRLALSCMLVLFIEICNLIISFLGPVGVCNAHSVSGVSRGLSVGFMISHQRMDFLAGKW